MVMLPGDLRIALRPLARSPGFLVASVASLGLAIGASIAAFSIIDAIRFRELPFPAADRLVVIGEAPAETPDARLRGCASACSVRYETWDGSIKPHAFRSLDAVAAFTSGVKSYSTGTDAVLVNGGIVTPNVFRLLEVRPVLGRAFMPDDDRLGAPLVTILSHGMWQVHFGSDSTIIGRVIKLSDSHYTVIGVMPRGFQFEVDSDFWLPVVPTLDPSTRPSIRSLQVIGRLRPGQTLEHLRAELSTIEIPVTAAAAAQPAVLAASGLRTRYVSSAASRDLVFGALVGCILLIACANLANLVLVRAFRQQREHAVRAALGAVAFRLARPVLVQNGTVVILSTVVGIGLAASTLGILRSLPSLSVLRPAGMDYRIDARVLAFAIVVASLAMLAVSLLPVRLALRGDVHDLLRGDRRAGDAGGVRMRKAFVVAQVACAAVLLTQAFLIAATLLRMGRVDAGYDVSRIVTASPSFPHPWRVPATYVPLVARMIDEVKRLPGVEAVAARNSVSLGGRDDGPRLTIDGAIQPPASTLPGSAFAVSPGYFATIGVPVLLGREFTDSDREAGPAVAVVNRRAADAWWPGTSPLGRTIRLTTGSGDPVTVTVVGVVRDNRATSGGQLLEDVGAEIHLPAAQFHSAFPQFLIRASVEPPQLIRSVRQLLTRLVPDRPLFTATASETIARRLGAVRTTALQVAAFALVGLLLAVIGVYGLLAYETARRTREIGIRSALGASGGAILRGILGETVMLSMIGIVVGFPAAMAVTRLFRGILVSDGSFDPILYASVAVGLVALSLVASYWPARRAASADPVNALRVD